MAVPSYTTDLTTINDGGGTFTEPTSATLGTLTNADTDNFIQGTTCSSKSTGASGAPALAGIGILAGAGQSITTPSAYYAWVFTGAGALVDTYANGGIRLIVGSSSANYKMWYVLGNNTFPYVGWTCIAVDPSLTADATIGTPTATLQYFGAVFNCLINISKGNPMALDAIRHGRVITATGGETSNYAVFSGLATENDTNTNRWGQFQAISGGYQLQGKLALGTSGTLVDFRDSNASVVIAVSLKTAASFNAIEIQNASSRVDMTSCNFAALSTVSRGTFTVTDNATVNLIGCSFTDMSTFTFLGNTVVTSCVFRRTDTITKGASTMTNCTIDNNRGATAVLASSPANAALISGTTFTSDGTGHAIEITGTAANFTLTNNTYTGYAASDGSTGNEAVYVNTSAGSMNLTVSGGTTPSVRVAAGVSVTVISGAVSASVNVKNSDGTNIENARVFVKAATGGPFPFDVTVTIVNSGTTATVTHTAHAMATNDKVVISGASHDANNGIFTITKINDNSYSYTMGSAPGSNPTGTIKCTFVVLSGLTDASGNITMSRVFPSDQPITGWARKASGAPFYKQSAISASVDSGTGFSATALLTLDD
ncbi:MAG: hypothetical protein A3G46_01640 [Candidatus Zambryskibacteria bacterium RIFCSPLOWO2_12_FULL_39_16]|uniref:Uncharacterized protein n=1 Tax=Candidatus Zambryskibacteria bacterium RIFCSPLOWO2_12_FULL_39_16 TaxID=1802775 RepID=A0A1G2UU44_9BACT|nr:MAG: hypothetical protein A3G46_01640 [Candidatus Zambryskibacteria bacterium RIFCSPLOWO2_12_FULL_39_16]